MPVEIKLEGASAIRLLILLPLYTALLLLAAFALGHYTQELPTKAASTIKGGSVETEIKVKPVVETSDLRVPITAEILWDNNRVPVHVMPEGGGIVHLQAEVAPVTVPVIPEPGPPIPLWIEPKMATQEPKVTKFGEPLPPPKVR